MSIHYNWAPRRGARGIELYCFSPRSWRLASNILRQAGHAYPTYNRGVKRNDFYVLRKNRRPAVLCELGFLSNAQDNRMRKALCLANGWPSASLPVSSRNDKARSAKVRAQQSQNG